MSSPQTSGVFRVCKPFLSKPNKNTYSQEGSEKGGEGAVCINNYRSPANGKASALRVLINFTQGNKKPILEESSCDLFTKPNLVGLRQLQDVLVDRMNVLKATRNGVGMWGM